MARRGRHHVQGVVEDRCRHQLAHIILLDHALEREVKGHISYTHGDIVQQGRPCANLQRDGRSAVDLVLNTLDERGAVLRLGHGLRLRYLGAPV